MKKLLILLMLTSLTAAAQDTGIHFLKAFSWQQVLDSAKAGHKYIFVDCYSTWCGPCKMMEQQVYPVSGNAYRDFICVKLQMDKTAKDNDTVKAWYPTAAMLQQTYAINAYPSFLFFDENGKAVHKAIGYQEPAAFIGLAAAAKDTTQQYYSLLAHYKSGGLDLPGILYLADNAGMLGDEQIGKEATKEYDVYLSKLEDSVLLEPVNVNFMLRHADLLRLNERLFKVCCQNARGDAYNLAAFIITRDLVNPQLQLADQQKNEPDWNGMEKNISSAYGPRYVSENGYLLDDKIGWYKYKKDGGAYTHWLTIKTEKVFKQSPVTAAQSEFYNNSAFDIFRYDNDKADLAKALHWMDRVNQLQPVPDASLLDTQAGVLYKLGRKKAALQLERRAVSLAKNNADIQSNYYQMKAGRATWPVARSFSQTAQ